jgi:hypothetical protein
MRGHSPVDNLELGRVVRLDDAAAGGGCGRKERPACHLRLFAGASFVSGRTKSTM